MILDRRDTLKRISVLDGKSEISSPAVFRKSINQFSSSKKSQDQRFEISVGKKDGRSTVVTPEAAQDNNVSKHTISKVSKSNEKSPNCHLSNEN